MQHMYQHLRRSASGGIGIGIGIGSGTGTGTGSGTDISAGTVSNDRKTYQPPMHDTSILESPSLLDIESRYL